MLCFDCRLAEQNTDSILDDPTSKEGKNQSHEELKETVDKCEFLYDFYHDKILTNSFFFSVLQKANNHMEHTMMGSFSVMLIASLMMNNEDNMKKIEQYFRPGCLASMVTTLEKYFNFIKLTGSVSSFYFGLNIIIIDSIFYYTISE